MSIEICKMKLTATCLSVAICALVVSGAYAGGQESILDQSIHDYTDYAEGEYAGAV